MKETKKKLKQFKFKKDSALETNESTYGSVGVKDIK
jgi:hypothetical protein